MHLPSKPRLLLLLLAAPALLCAQAIDKAEDKPARSKELSNRAVTVSGPSERVSSNISAAISSTLPKYQPPPPPKEEKPSNDLTDSDKEGEIDDPDSPVDPNNPDAPRNKIIRLPKHVVYGERPPVFTEREVYTKKGLAELAAKRYLSNFDRNVLNRYTLPLIGLSPEQRAMMMYEQDQRLQDITDLKDSANNAQRAGDKGEANALRDETNRAFIRSGDMGPLPKN